MTRGNAIDLGRAADAEMETIIAEEERVLERVRRTLELRAKERLTPEVPLIDYDTELLALRDQIRDARLEDIPPLVEEMERLQQVASRRAKVTEGVVDAGAPYFGRLVLEEGERKREVLIGRSTFLDPKTGVRIVDWRDAPISRVYYRYEQGDDYEETFGGRDVEGEVLVRRSLAIKNGQLTRIGCPQGTFVRGLDGTWRRAGESAVRLRGGQGTALRPESHHRPGRLGVGEAVDRPEDKHLAEITALIDPRQFELITHESSGLVVIQGGAGSGKTTIGLHRLAYLAFHDPQRFRPERMLIVVFNDALVRYISRVLPALGVDGVPVVTYEKWAQKLRRGHIAHLPEEYAEDTPAVVVRLKKHPVMLELIDAHAQAILARVEDELVDTAKKLEGGARPLKVWRATEGQPVGRRIDAVLNWSGDPGGDAAQIPLRTRHAVERVLKLARTEVRDVVGAWAEILTDRKKLGDAFAAHAPEAFTERELDWAHGHCARRCTALVSWREEEMERERDLAERGTLGSAEDDDRAVAVDGEEPDEERAILDREDDTLLLRVVQRMRGPLAKKNRSDDLRFEHVFVDEAQDLSPVELAVVLDTATERQSVTLAGDVAQRMYRDNGFTEWRGVLHELGLDHVAVEPLRLSYRSTHEIIEFSTEILGPLRNEVEGQATRHGAPVELFKFEDSGEAVGFLSEALRELVRAEPLASVAVITRYPEQADLYHKGLTHGEVPNLRRIAEQDFPFRPGVDVTDVRQVKGLEFDYVILVEVNERSYPADDEARHLLHIAATRAAHQLWVVTTGTASPILPAALLASST